MIGIWGASTCGDVDLFSGSIGGDDPDTMCVISMFLIYIGIIMILVGGGGLIYSGLVLAGIGLMLGSMQLVMLPIYVSGSGFSAPNLAETM
jgi:hypothetical protein